MSYAFYIFAFIAVAAALGILFARRLFHAALLLLVCFLAVAGIYAISFAEWVAVTQILVYAGGVVVIIIFGIKACLHSALNSKNIMVYRHRSLSEV